MQNRHSSYPFNTSPTSNSSGDQEFYDAVPMQQLTANKGNNDDSIDCNSHSMNNDRNHVNKMYFGKDLNESSNSFSRSNARKGEAAVNALAKAFFPNLEDTSEGYDFDRHNQEDSRIQIRTNNSNDSSDFDKLKLISPASNVTFRKRNFQYSNGHNVSHRSKRTRNFQRQRKETKAALIEKLPWHLEAISVLLAMCAGVTVIFLVFGLVMMFLMSGTTYRPDFGI